LAFAVGLAKAFLNIILQSGAGGLSAAAFFALSVIF